MTKTGVATAAASSDSGQAVSAMMLMLGLAATALLVLVEVGQILDDRARASTAADAAALAGAVNGYDAALQIAEANGGSLTSFSEHRPANEVDTVMVTVSTRVGRASSQARAEATTQWVRPSHSEWGLHG